MNRELIGALLLAALLAPTTPAGAVDHHFAGSAQVDYHLVPTARAVRAVPGTLDGFTFELAGKVVADLTEHTSAHVKVCFGCHGFELGMGYFDLRVADALNFRVGRFSPSFGAFNLRHDPANHRLSDKPLPYDMGRMLRMREWNQGVLPSPFPDNGVEINGSVWLTGSSQIDYAAYAVSGFKGSTTATDLDFALSRSPSSYYTDNDARPSGGARIAWTQRLGSQAEFTLGASGMAGTYDPESRLGYVILGGDASLRAGDTQLRAEYLIRRTDMDTSRPDAFKYPLAAVRGDFFVKDGAYLEAERTIVPGFAVIVRGDGMRRHGNVEKASALSSSSTVWRGTIGTAWFLDGTLRLKLSVEGWRFSDRDPVAGNLVELSTHLGVAGAY